MRALLAIILALLTQIASATSYTTSFGATENPISEAGRWVNGGTTGLDWTNVSITPGLAIGHQVGADFTDATATLTGAWGPDQQVSAHVHTVNQANLCFQEAELRLRTTITAHSITGYEVGWHMLNDLHSYLIIVRWNGALGSFDYLFNQTSATYGVQNGDLLTAKIVGNIITAYVNGVQKAAADITSIGGTVYSTGKPGMGFNLENAEPGCSGTNGDYGYTDFTATDFANTVYLPITVH